MSKIEKEKDGSHGRNCDRKKHIYGLTAHYNTKGEPPRMVFDGATGCRECEAMAKEIGLSISYEYDNRRNLKIVFIG